MLELSMIHTLALAALAIFAGHGVRRIFPVLARLNVPAPVLGGLLIAAGGLMAGQWTRMTFRFDTALQTPCMIAFFTSIGFAASAALLKSGGRLVLVFFGVSIAFALLQNLVGIAVALPFGLHPLFGVLAGSVTLTGGPATGLAFAPLFEKAGVQGAAVIAVATAMAGIVSGGIIGGPIATALITRHRLRAPLATRVKGAQPVGAHIVEEKLAEPALHVPAGEDRESYVLLKNLAAMLAAMWIGSALSAAFESLGLTLPAYIGAMLAAALLRNIDDATRVIGISQRTVDDLGSVALSLFIAMALMSLDLRALAGLALPLLAILAAQVLLVAAACVAVFRLMGRDYEAAVMSGGFAGFMLGTTANAMANMETLVETYGRAPRAFLVVPMVGAFFIDFANALLITGFLNVLK
ncbi:MAG: sodium/glutamate symporter [Ignavibacteria bacterium]|nr:sodium/glutamate symporter [Ignavibacteria bacterium]